MVRALQHVASTHHVELVIAGKEYPLDLLLLVALGDDVAPEDLEPALAIPDLFPAVGRAMPPAGFTGGAVITPVEGQETRSKACETLTKQYGQIAGELRFLDPGEGVGRIEGAGAVVARRIATGVKPAAVSRAISWWRLMGDLLSTQT
jgi:hypothetical protein